MTNKPEAHSEAQLFLEDLRRREFNAAVNRECDMYAETGDGRFLWRAFLRMHEGGEPIPKSFLDKFAQWADRLLAAETPNEIAAALELAGNAKEKRGPKQSEAYRKRRRVATEVELVRELYGITPTEAIRTVVRNTGKNFAAVKKSHDQVLRASLRKHKKAKDANGRELGQVMSRWGR